VALERANAALEAARGAERLADDDWRAVRAAVKAKDDQRHYLEDQLRRSYLQEVVELRDAPSDLDRDLAHIA
jgi:hypothetical protein